MKIDLKSKTVQIWLTIFILLVFVVGVSAYILEGSSIPTTDIKGNPLISEDCPEFNPPNIISIENNKAPITQLTNYIKVPDPVEYGK
ncbi:type IV secretion system protein, partial [Candidatus Magnetomorum sp. HK-1]